MKAENLLILIASAAVYLLLQSRWAQAAPQTASGTDMLSLLGGNNMAGVFYRDYR